jgi:dipeptidase E
MKLLLTSNGLSNNSIAKAFQDLVGKEPKDAKVAFIPTAANAERGNKYWLIDDMYQVRERGYAVDVVELTAHQPNELAEILSGMDAIFVGGGNTFYLLEQLRKSSLDKWLNNNKARIVYVGSSAGSIVITPTIKLAEAADKNLSGLKDLNGLSWVDFEFMPHVPDFIPTEKAAEYANLSGRQLYAMDNMSALKVLDGKVEVISEGQWKLFNN